MAPKDLAAERREMDGVPPEETPEVAAATDCKAAGEEADKAMIMVSSERRCKRRRPADGVTPSLEEFEEAPLSSSTDLLWLAMLVAFPS